MIRSLDPSQTERPHWAFFIGPDKAGSTWIHNALSAHPAVETPTAKDLFYFDRFYARGDRWYLRHFEPTPGTQVLAEVCHDYLFDLRAPARIRRFSPGALLLACARNPVDRAASAYLYMVRQGRIPPSVSFAEAIRSVPELLDHGRYGRWLDHWMEHFPRSQITLLDFDELVDDPQCFAGSLFTAIGAPPFTLPSAQLAPSRPAAVARWQPVATMGKRIALALRRVRGERVLGRLKGDTLERLLFRAAELGEKPIPSAADRSYVRAELEADTDHLDQILGTNYSRRWWSNSE